VYVGPLQVAACVATTSRALRELPVCVGFSLGYARRTFIFARPLVINGRSKASAGFFGGACALSCVPARAVRLLGGVVVSDSAASARVVSHKHLSSVVQRLQSAPGASTWNPLRDRSGAFSRMPQTGFGSSI